MSKGPSAWLVFKANLSWCLSCFPAVWRFYWSSLFVRSAQSAVLRRQGRRGQQGRLTEYENLDMETIHNTGSLPGSGERVLRLIPTSGTLSASKLIPYTESLLSEMREAFNAWVGGLYQAFPSLLFGRQYWSISPHTAPGLDVESKVPIGFLNDTEYMSPRQRNALGVLLAVPPAVASVEDADQFNYLTLLFLLREKNLRLISVWHPSFLTILLDELPEHLPRILEALRTGYMRADMPEEFENQFEADPARADELDVVFNARDVALCDVWPRLRVISCWTHGHAESWVHRIRRMFPRTFIQPKGLLATEGIVSFPWGRRTTPVSAMRSHYLELKHVDTDEVLPLWRVRVAHEYSVLLTTAGGLNRYQLHDLVRIEGRFLRAPCFRFLGRENDTCDLVGEKLSGRHVDEVLSREIGGAVFSMIAPVASGYVLFAEVEGEKSDCRALRDRVEVGLCENYYYAHALERKQLAPLRVYCCDQGADAAYRRRMVASGMTAGDVKLNALSTLTDWSGHLLGHYVGEE